MSSDSSPSRAPPDGLAPTSRRTSIPGEPAPQQLTSETFLGVAMSPAEVERTRWLFGLLFLAAIIFVVGRTARDALFLTQYPVTWIAPMWIAYGVASAGISLGFAYVVGRYSRARLATVFALFAAATYVALRLSMAASLRPAFAIFYVWSDIVSNLVIALAWAIAQDYHDARSAKRLFGLIGAGQVVGTILFGFSASVVVRLVGTENLVALLVVVLVAYAAMVREIKRRLPRAPAAPTAALRERTDTRAWLGDRYVLSIAAFTIVVFTVLTIADYQFKAVARSTYPDRDELAHFTGNFYGVVGAVGLAIQLWITPWLLRRFGVLYGMLVMPLAVVGSATGLLVSPSIALATTLKGSDNGLQFTLHDATMQLLLFPFPAAVRDRVRTFIAGVTKPLGCAAGALVLIAIAPGSSESTPGPALVALASRLGLWVVPLGLVAVAIAPRVRDGYVAAMRRTLVRREASPDELVVSPTVQRVLKEALESGDAPQVLFAIDRLRPIDPELLRRSLPELARHRSARVRAIALRLTIDLDDDTGPALARAALRDARAEVRTAAIEALAWHLGEDAHDELVALADQPSDEVTRGAAIAALVRDCGLDGMLNGAPRLRALLESARDEDRVAAAHVLGMVGEAGLHRALARLLVDPSLDVRKAAADAASKVGSPRLLPVLFEALSERALAPAAAGAIAVLGNAAVPAIATRLVDDATPYARRLALPRVLYRIGTEQALAALLDRLDEPDELLRQKVLASASRLRLALRAPPLPLSQVSDRIEREVAEHVRTRDEYFRVRALVERPLLDEAVVLRLRKGLIRVLRLCELAYPREVVASVRAHLFGPDSVLRANALEVLESLLDAGLRARLVAAVERLDRIRAGDLPAPSPSVTDVEAQAFLRAELAQRDPYRVALALDAIANRRLTALAADAVEKTSHHDPLVRENAGIAVAVLAPPEAAAAREALLGDADEVVAGWARYWSSSGSAGLDPKDLMYTTIEKVLFLQRIPVFSKVGGEDLVTLARGAVVVTRAKGNVLFREGDPGASLFFIISGAVRLTREGREVARLGPNDVFGELSIFDREPRQITAVMLEDTELLRVSSDDFREAARESVEIAEGVIKVLNRRLHEADRRIASLGGRVEASDVPPAPEPREDLEIE